MAKRFDIGLQYNDLIIQNNDVLLVDSDEQHIIDNINACAGWWKENATSGIGILTFYKGVNVQQKLNKKAKIQLKTDNYESSPIITYDKTGTLNFDPNVTI